MKRIKNKKYKSKIPIRKVVANEKLIPWGYYCYSPIPDSEGTTYSEKYKTEVPTFKVKNCPYLKFEIFEDEEGNREAYSFCSLIGLELDDEIKECGINVTDDEDIDGDE